MTDYQIKKQSKLHDSWSFWYQPRGKKAHTDPTNYIYHLRHIAGCATAEEFFQLYTYLKRPSEIPVDNKVLFFRKNCKPLWEEWPHGGCWIMMVNKKAAVEINRRWEALLLACIGE
jgi:translation initiation factor 4E